jgi:hypothetical protein
MAEKPMTTRAAQRKAPANGETSLCDVEGAILEPLSDGNAHMVLSGDDDPADADEGGPAAAWGYVLIC